eukprot:129577_1
MEEEPPAVVCDNGSGMMKAGFAGDDAPRAVFPTVTGRPRHQGGGTDMTQKRRYVGDEALSHSKRDILNIYRPIEGGLITHWVDMERIWHHTWYNELRIAPEEHGLLMTESPLSPKLQREKTTQIMFESFNVPKFYLVSTSLLACYSQGHSTGVVLESGDGGTTVSPIFEGYALPMSKENHLDLTGFMFTNYPSKAFNTTAHEYYEQEKIRNMKISLYGLPDGEKITINESRFDCCEALFNPQLMGIENRGGVDQMIYDAVMKCDADKRMDVFSHIVIAGGNTMFKGFQQRLELEMSKQMCKPTVIDGFARQHYGIKTVSQDVLDLMCSYAKYEYKMYCPPERKYSVWIGGSILASLSTFEEMWIYKDEYDETGPTIVQKKCPPT